jgi:hypothetical protein
MKHIWEFTLLVGAGVGLFLGPKPVLAQACKDETSMVDGSKQALVELIDTVKKESLTEFGTLNHQKSAVNKLGLHGMMLGELATCLDKATQDPTTPKQDLDAAKAQHEATVKIQEKVKQQQGAIKDAKTPQDAKALVEKLDLAP